MGVIQCKYHDLEIKALEKKTLDELKDCGCERCQSVFDQKNYERLQGLEQELILRQEAEKRGELLGKAVEDEAKKLEQTVEQIEVEAAKNYLARKGLDLEALAKAPFWNKIESKGVGALQGKRVFVNSGAGKSEYEMKLFDRYLREGDQNALMELKALNEATDSAGGYTVPTDFLNQLVEKRWQNSVALRAGVRLIRISGDRIEIPVEGNAAAGDWVTEGTDISTVSTDPTFGQIVLEPDDYAVLVAASRQLLRDSGINVADFLTTHFGRVLAKKFDESVFNGPAGGPGPVGILNDTNITNTVAASNTAAGEPTLKADDLIDAFFKLEPQYQERTVWVMNNFTAGVVRKLQDTSGRYLWDISRGGITEGVAGELLGRPVYVTNAIPHDATNGDKIIIADLSYYYCAESGGMEIARDDSVFFHKNQVAFRAIMSLDGQVALPEAFAMVTGVKMNPSA